MTRKSASRHRRGSFSGAAILTLMALAPASTFAQPQACDCSCEGHAEMKQLMEQASAAARAGNYQDMPAGTQQMSLCAGQCAAQWVHCDNPAVSNAADRVQQQHARSEPKTRSALPKAQLTAAYLEGMWCSVYGGQETAQWHFDTEGNYEIGLPAGGGFAMQGHFKSLAEFHDRFDRLVEFDTDTFTTEHVSGRISRMNVFTRGACQ